MIWIFLVLAAIAIGLIAFGAMSVWLAMLFTALKLILIVLVPVGLYLLWEKFYRSRRP